MAELQINWMTNDKSYLKINFLPLIVISLLILVSILGASFWNEARTESKLARIQEHTERIYEAHKDEFVTAIKSTERNSYGYFINQVNVPERGIYNVSILIKDDKGNYSIRNSWSTEGVDVEVANRLNSILSNEKAISTSEDIFANDPNEEGKLSAFTPIKEGGKVIGFVMVSVRKDQDL